MAAQVLNYQPFVITDNLQTGVAYSWFHTADPRVSAPLVFERLAMPEAEWDKVTSCNAALRAMYDKSVRAIADRYPKGTLFDVACNNGYFPVRAEMYGMGRSAGMDAGPQYGDSLKFLNSVCGTHAKFCSCVYDTATHTAPVKEKYDVVVASAIMCHLPDPTHFLAFLGRIAKQAIFYWGQILDQDELIIAYKPPNLALDLNRAGTPFPRCFNDNTRVSRGLLETSFRLMGFRDIVYFESELLPVGPKMDLATEIRQGSYHWGVLAMR